MIAIKALAGAQIFLQSMLAWSAWPTGVGIACAGVAAMFAVFLCLLWLMDP